jgi:prepilin-type N-terminal cleavage/methylation domain-containing protein
MKLSPLQSRQRSRHGSAGFTLLEVLIAVVVLTIGMLGILSVFTTAIAATQSSQEDQIARQEASEAMESIFAARDTAQIAFNQIQNQPNGIFLVGFQDIKLPGADGLDGTVDDAGLQSLTLPGSDGVLGTADDQLFLMTNYQRQIQINQVVNPATGLVDPNLRQVVITIRYYTPQFAIKRRDYVLTSYISAFR